MIQTAVYHGNTGPCCHTGTPSSWADWLYKTLSYRTSETHGKSLLRRGLDSFGKTIHKTVWMVLGLLQYKYFSLLPVIKNKQFLFQITHYLNLNHKFRTGNGCKKISHTMPFTVYKGLQPWSSWRQDQLLPQGTRSEWVSWIFIQLYTVFQLYYSVILQN